MSDSEIEERHKAEKKALQARIQQIKNLTPKGDKKRQRETKAEIANLEKELKTRHDEELKQATKTVTDKLEAVSLKPQSSEISASQNDPLETSPSTDKKKSKAQKRREKKEQEERDRTLRIAEGEIEALSGARHIEQEKISQILRERKLRLYDIPSDGNCMYKAVAHQISIHTGQAEKSVQEIRSITADQMRRNVDDYLPYLSNSDGDMLSAEEYNQYCNTVENSVEWGGHVELNALVTSTGHSLEVLQADQPTVIVENRVSIKAPLVLVYHRKLYELGEHYNSTVPYEEES